MFRGRASEVKGNDAGPLEFSPPADALAARAGRRLAWSAPSGGGRAWGPRWIPASGPRRHRRIGTTLPSVKRTWVPQLRSSAPESCFCCPRSRVAPLRTEPTVLPLLPRLEPRASKHPARAIGSVMGPRRFPVSSTAPPRELRRILSPIGRGGGPFSGDHSNLVVECRGFVYSATGWRSPCTSRDSSTEQRWARDTSGNT
jgi:hypothetical protein